MSSGPSPSEIKEARQYLFPSCTACFKSGQDLRIKMCARCKTSRYCSKECQKNDWSIHKRACTLNEGSGSTKLVGNLMSNNLLHVHLEMMFILEFDVLNNPNLIREPFMARIDTAMEPVKLEDFRSLIESKDTPETMEGMLQFINFVSPQSGGPNTPLTPLRRNVWEMARRGADATGYVDSPVGIVEFYNDVVESTTIPIHISQYALDVVRDNPAGLQIPTGGHGEYITKPMLVTTCMEALNASIRFDTENQWLLRKPMRDSEKQIIRDLAGLPTTFSSIFFWGKMNRESIYAQPFT